MLKLSSSFRVVLVGHHASCEASKASLVSYSCRTGKSVYPETKTVRGRVLAKRSLSCITSSRSCFLHLQLFRAEAPFFKRELTSLPTATDFTGLGIGTRHFSTRASVLKNLLVSCSVRPRFLRLPSVDRKKKRNTEVRGLRFHV